jgi:cell division protein FtsA
MKENENNPVIVGLDIGTTKIVAIAGRKNPKGKLEILGFGEVEYNGIINGIVMNIEQCVNAIDVVMKKCLETCKGLKVSEVYASIGGMHIKSIQTRSNRIRTKINEEISKKDVELLICDQYKTHIALTDEIIEVIPQEFIIDNVAYVANPIGMCGTKIGANFHIITSDKGAIHNIKRCIDKAGLQTKDLVLQQLASAAAVTDNEDLEAGVVVVDIGGGTTDVAIYSEGILKHTAIIPFGGVNITDAIRNDLGILRSQAEQIKIEYGTAITDEANENEIIKVAGLRGFPAKEIPIKKLSEIIQAQIQEILDFVLYHLKQLNLEKGLHGGIIITGGSSLIKNIEPLTNSITGMCVRVGYATAQLADGYPEIIANPRYATCVGLVLKGYEKLENGFMQNSIDSNNFIHLKDEEEINMHNENNSGSTIPPANDAGNEIVNGKKKHDGMKGLFSGIKYKFIRIFESEEDEIMN